MTHRTVIIVVASSLIVCGFITTYLFRSPKPKVNSSHVYGLILPHHLLASSLVANSLDRLHSTISPTQIVLLGTNHFLPQGPSYITNATGSAKLQSFPAIVDDNLIMHDHSIQSLIPFIQQSLPNASIIPILVSARHNPLSYYLANGQLLSTLFDNSQTLYIASVDFAHEVSLEEGLQHNNQTVNMLEDFSYQSLSQLNDSYIDSPTTLITLLSIMQSIGATRWETWFSTHGAQIENRIDALGTSYVIGSFSKSFQ